MAKIYLIKSEIDRIPIPPIGKRVEYFDTKLPGFGLRVTDSKRAYFVIGRVNGSLVRYTIGNHGIYTPDAARDEAKSKLLDMSRGINPNKEKAKARKEGITLADVMDSYFQTRPNLRPETVRSYKSLINNHLSTWLKKPMEEITGEMVSKKHLDIARKSGQAQANKCMRVVRLLFNHMSVIHDKSVDNPVKRLSNARQWFRNERRTSIIREADLKAWHDAVMSFSNPVQRDYLLLLLFTGMREREGLTLRWEDVDMQSKTFTVRAEIAKNHQAHTLPMSPLLFDLFNRRLALRENDWVFPGFKEGRHITETRRAIEHVTKQTGLKWSLHDLRRTFATFAEQETTYAMLKRLLNHSQAADVTAGYLVISTEQLRVPMQRITERILKTIKGKQSTGGKVIQLRS